MSSGTDYSTPSTRDHEKQVAQPGLVGNTQRSRSRATIRTNRTHHGTFPEAAQRILEYGCSSVLIKGGHSDDVLCHDLWTDGDNMIWMNSKRVETHNNHGTGCVLSSAITASLARGEDAGEALLTGKSFVHQALRKSVNIGEGPGPLGIEPWPQSPLDLPTVTATIEEAKENYTFPHCALQNSSSTP